NQGVPQAPDAGGAPPWAGSSRRSLSAVGAAVERTSFRAGVPVAGVQRLSRRTFSPTSPNFYPAPVGVLPVPKLHSLIAIEVNAQFRVIIFRKLEPKRVDSLPVRCQYDQMIRL